MATVIRLKRGGRTHEPYYRVVVLDSRSKLTGRGIEELGIDQPFARPGPPMAAGPPTSGAAAGAGSGCWMGGWAGAASSSVGSLPGNGAGVGSAS